MARIFYLLVLIASSSPPQTATGDVSPIADGETALYHGTINQELEVELTARCKGRAIERAYEDAAH